MIKDKIKWKLRSILGINELRSEVSYGFNEQLNATIDTKLDEKLTQKLNEVHCAEIAYLAQLETNLRNELNAKHNENATFEQQIYDRIVATENNLNYYSMINSILKEHKYTGLELIRAQNSISSGKKILLIGFYGADNLGDELMLQSILYSFPKEMHKNITVMLCDNDSYDYSHLPGVNFLHIPQNAFDYNILATQFDALVWGGGALIDDCYYDTKSVCLNNMLIDLSLRFIAFDKEVYALGLSTNSTLESNEYIEKLKLICKASKCFSIRDAYSFNILKDLDIDGISRIEDPVLYEKLPLSLISQDKENPTVKIGIIWICYPDTVEKFKLLLDKISNKFKNQNYEICLIPFYNYVNLDKKYFEENIQDLPYADKISIFDYSNRLKKITEHIDELDYLISIRYHGILLGAMMGKPSFNICYDTHRHYPNKIKYLTELFNLNKKTVLFSKLDEKTELEFSAPTPSTQIKSSALTDIIAAICK